MQLASSLCFASGCLLRLNVPVPRLVSKGQAASLALRNAQARPIAAWLPLRMSDLSQWPEGLALRREEFYAD